MKINEKIKELRLEAGLTQGELGRLIYGDGAELTPAAISQYESGKRNISFETIESICSCLGYELKIELVNREKFNSFKNGRIKKPTEEILKMSFNDRVNYLFTCESDIFLSKFLDIKYHLFEKLSPSIVKECIEERLSGIECDMELEYALNGESIYMSKELVNFGKLVGEYILDNVNIADNIKKDAFYIYVEFDYEQTGHLPSDGYYYISDAKLYDINNIELQVNFEDIYMNNDIPLDDSIDNEFASIVQEYNHLSDNNKYLIKIIK